MTQEPDEITFGPGAVGTIQLASALPTIDWNVQIIGPPGQDPPTVTIRGEGSADKYRIFTIVGQVTPPLVVGIKNLTITNGWAAVGGGISANVGTVTIDNCDIRENFAAPVIGGEDLLGGGIYNGGVMTISDSLITSNEVYGFNPIAREGGGIHNLLGTLTITTSEISNNKICDIDQNRDCGLVQPATNVTTLFHGGGISHYHGSAKIFQSTISNNKVYAIDNNNPVVRGAGGGIKSQCATEYPLAYCLEVIESTFSGNLVYMSGNVAATEHSFPIHGGGISVEGDVDDDNDNPTYPDELEVRILNSTIANNSVDTNITGTGCPPAMGVPRCRVSGGGVWTKWLALELKYSTIVGNIAHNDNSAAPASGGGMDIGSVHADSFVFLRTTIVANNSSDAANDENIDGGIDSKGYNLFGTHDFDCYGAGLPPPCVLDQFDAAPDLQPLGNYGGPTKTMRPSTGSLVLNKGGPSGIGDPTVDQRGLNRFVGTASDVGAVECQAVNDCVGSGGGDSPPGIPPPDDGDGYQGTGGAALAPWSQTTDTLNRVLPERGETADVTSNPAEWIDSSSDTEEDAPQEMVHSKDASPSWVDPFYAVFDDTALVAL